MRTLILDRILRPLLLLSLTVSVTIGAPRLASVFRAPSSLPERPSNKIESTPASVPVPVAALTPQPAPRAEEPQSVKLIPAALQPARPPVTSEAAPPPAVPQTEEELVEAISKELARLEF
jgi:hypothetical protein